MKVTLNHKCSIQGARWCTPSGWEPDNRIEGAEFTECSWWDDTEEVAGLVYFGEGDEGDTVDATFANLKVASTGNCRIIGELEFGEEVEEIQPGVYETANGDVIVGGK